MGARDRLLKEINVSWWAAEAKILEMFLNAAYAGGAVNKTFYLREGTHDNIVLTKKPGITTENFELCEEALDFLDFPKVADNGKLYRINVSITEIS